MSNHVYFDMHEGARGNTYRVVGRIETDEGRGYTLDEWINRGGNATVYRCTEEGTGDEYAIKILMNDGRKSAKRFFREVELLKSLTSPHVTRYRGAGKMKLASRSTRKVPFVVMELADQSLQEYMVYRKRRIAYEEYAGQFRGLAQALADLHKLAIHRDIKPENVLISGDRWLLSDYGLCALLKPVGVELTQENQNIGPKFWLSPEAHNRRVGCADVICEASDVFQLAAVFWYVATGRHPSGVLAHSDWTGPTKLFDVLYRSLSHNVHARPADGAEFLRQLEESLES